ncbi:DUF6607 family protein [Jiulongibacter sp. NS-SX5]|uniref:DUF6607 family protein n=1 Tax=Jiulongibacter sp. NS-SX5 TaxID=3463854 RepID=UPI0040585E40
MMKKLVLTLAFLSSLSSVFAQNTKDIDAIKGQCGCFDITFKYAETFAPDTSYKFHDRYLAKGREYVFVVDEDPQNVIIQHLLVIRDTMIIKHWREDWSFKDDHLLSFHTANDFRYSNVASENYTNGWTQWVYGTQDEPRYAGYGEWAHINGKSVWESAADAALPRREYSHRSDYNVMNRGNRIHVTEKGYLHEQDNQKIVREEGKPDVLLASEKGYNDYVKTDMAKCEAAKVWWEKNHAFWNEVRAAWDDLENQHKSFTLKDKVNDQRLGSYIYDLEHRSDLPTEDVKAEMKKILDQFVVFQKSI